MAKKKFDTNPLDPTFPERAQREAETVPLPKSQFKTSGFAPPSITEEETRRFDDANFGNHASPYNGQDIPANYKTAKLADMNRTSSRNVAKIGMPEKWLIVLPYIPWIPGLIASLIILFIVPKSETKVRFHAAQGLAAHIGILIVGAILSGFGNISGFGSAGNIFQAIAAALLIVWAIKAWQGKPVHIESVDDLTEWLEEKIKPRN